MAIRSYKIDSSFPYLLYHPRPSLITLHSTLLFLEYDRLSLTSELLYLLIPLPEILFPDWQSLFSHLFQFKSYLISEDGHADSLKSCNHSTSSLPALLFSTPASLFFSPAALIAIWLWYILMIYLFSLPHSHLYFAPTNISLIKARIFLI